MANEKLKESIVRAACDAQYFFDEWHTLQNKMPGYSEKVDPVQLKKMQDERNDASTGFTQCRAQLFRMVKKLKEKEPDYDD